MKWPVNCGYLVSSVLLLVGCAPESTASHNEANFQYIRDTLGDVVLEYQASHGHIPEEFDTGLSEYGKSLAHRGDIDGHGITYSKIGPEIFMFISSGRNNKMEMGHGDDLVVVCSNGIWSVRDGAYVAKALQRLEHGTNPQAEQSIQRQNEP
ncbi:MAG: hypothetical protein ACYC3X_31855 [Pirellulaceae bacterium]